MLLQYDIPGITSAKQNWWENKQTYALLLEDADSGEPVGAVRLQRWGNGVHLPIQSALADVDRRIHAWIASFADEGVGELCGLWCSPELKGFGLGPVLTRMGLSLSSQVRTRTILGLCDTRNVGINVELGFMRDPTLARDGTFEYPKPGLQAHVLRIVNARRLEAATRDNRLAVQAYRDAPVGREVIQGKRGSVVLERDLRIARAPRLSERFEVLARHVLPQRAHQGLRVDPSSPFHQPIDGAAR